MGEKPAPVRTQDRPQIIAWIKSFVARSPVADFEMDGKTLGAVDELMRRE